MLGSERVEVVAEAIHSVAQDNPIWDLLPDDEKEAFRAQARAALLADPVSGRLVETSKEKN